MNPILNLSSPHTAGRKPARNDLRSSIRVQHAFPGCLQNYLHGRAHLSLGHAQLLLNGISIGYLVDRTHPRPVHVMAFLAKMREEIFEAGWIAYTRSVHARRAPSRSGEISHG